MLQDIISWIGIIISISTSLVKAFNIGYMNYTFIFSSLANVLLIYNAYTLGSTQMIIMYTFHLLISLTGVYRWTKNNKNEKKED